MRLLVGLAIAAILVSAQACSELTPQQNCALEGAELAILIVGGSSIGLAVGEDCGPGCVEHKIAKGESVHESIQHHLNRRDDYILYAILPSTAVAGAIGALLGYYICPAP